MVCDSFGKWCNYKVHRERQICCSDLYKSLLLIYQDAFTQAFMQEKNAASVLSNDQWFSKCALFMNAKFINKKQYILVEWYTAAHIHILKRLSNVLF